MKKLAALSVGALLMGGGLVATTGTAAHADPYPGAVATTTSVTAPAKVKFKHTANVCATVAVKSGTGTPVGKVTISVTRNKGGFSESAVLPYTGTTVCFRTSKLKKKGGYTARADYVSTPGTVFTDSSGAAGFDVKKKKKH